MGSGGVWLRLMLSLHPIATLERTMAGCPDAPIPELSSHDRKLKALFNRACTQTLSDKGSYTRLRLFWERLVSPELSEEFLRKTSVWLYKVVTQYAYVLPDFPVYLEGKYFGSVPGLALGDHGFTLLFANLDQEPLPWEQQATNYAPTAGIWANVIEMALTERQVFEARILTLATQEEIVIPPVREYYDVTRSLLGKAPRRPGVWCHGCPHGCHPRLLAEPKVQR